MKSFKVRSVRAVLWLAFSLQFPGFATLSQAQNIPEDSAYFTFKPFITNFDGDSLGMIKVDASLRIDATLESAVARHLPAIRHEIIMLLNRQQDEILSTVDGREQIRLEAIDVIRRIIRTEEGRKGVNDLLFTAFLTEKN